MRRLSVKIGRDGNVVVTPTGFGSSCSDVVEKFKSLGEVFSEEDTEEMWEESEEEEETENEHQ